MLCDPECYFIPLQDVGEKREAGADGGGVKGGAQQQWKISLLEHIETMQEEVTQRMDFIERELDGMQEGFRGLDLCFAIFHAVICIMGMFHVYYDYILIPNHCSFFSA